MSSLRHYFANVQTNIESKIEENKEIENEVKECKADIQKVRTWASSRTGQVAPSMDTVRRETDVANPVPAPVGNAGKLYSEAVRAEGRREKRYQLMITSRTAMSDEIKNIIKKSVNLTIMKVGIRALKSLRDGIVIMETKSKEHLEILYTNINDKCRQLLEANKQKPRNPKLVIYNIPEKMNAENAEEIITTQNTELILNAGEVKTKFTYKGK